MNPTKSQINPTKSIPRINSCLSHIWSLVPVLCRVRLPGPLWPGADLAGVPACSHPAVLWPWGQQRLVVSRVQRTEGIRACQLPWQDVLRVKIFYVANREHLRFGSLENIFVHGKKKIRAEGTQHPTLWSVSWSVQRILEWEENMAHCSEHFFSTSVL